MKTTCFPVLFWALFFYCATAQSPAGSPPDIPKEDIELPEFPGGQGALLRYLGENIVYPVFARENGIEGTVSLTFVVEKNGSISNVTITGDIGGGCGQEAARVVSAMPKWAPGSLDGMPIRVRHTLPVLFRLEDPDPAPVDSTQEDDSAYEIFDLTTPPAFPGGEPALLQYLSMRIRYPEAARTNNIEGTVLLVFIVEPDGAVTNATVIRDIGGGCGDEALRVVTSMPNWSPGIANGRPVRVRFTLPIRFRLEGKTKSKSKKKKWWQRDALIGN
ncbi:MAG: energy transducer TonB [Saprospirales bacterium]|jgi:TonB family protein|nr:energy transducer TonB [Saprospirales bacterium]MBK8923871.1 energy transducer TonB [Saprospirales bacterium]